MTGRCEMRCSLCARPTDAGTLRCECGALFLDQVRQLGDEDADSLIASNAAWLAAEVAGGRRMVRQSLGLGFVPMVVAGVALSFGAGAPGLVFGSLLVASAAWGLRGGRRIRASRRIATANRIALPPARVRTRA